MVQVKLQANILSSNELLARRNRTEFQDKEVLVINMMSSPGAGKTTILERTLETLSQQLLIGVIEGDLYTDQDAQRIEQKGVQVIQINTEGTCHLDASMVRKAYNELPGSSMDLIVIENVGNLVCPAEFDLGEDFKVVVISTAEGNDKPLKYPLIFREAKAVLLNKIDLLPYTDFGIDRFYQDLSKINPQAEIFQVSGRTGQGIGEWSSWLFKEVNQKKITTLPGDKEKEEGQD